MNSKKIAIICCTNHEKYKEECLGYIARLMPPEGFEVDLLWVEKAKSMAAGYNEAMKQSDAKYKIYIHQDTFILNENILTDIVSVFQKDEQIGLIGVVGCLNLPSDGVMWHSKRVGNIYALDQANISIDQFEVNNRLDREVDAVDGMFIATQYDIPWREDLFTGWDFYDVSQCMEFKKQGYKIVVPKQEFPWVLHDCGAPCILEKYERQRKVFLKEYQQYISDEKKENVMCIGENVAELLDVIWALEEDNYNIKVRIEKTKCEDPSFDVADYIVSNNIDAVISFRKSEDQDQFFDELDVIHIPVDRSKKEQMTYPNKYEGVAIEPEDEINSSVDLMIHNASTEEDMVLLKNQYEKKYKMHQWCDFSLETEDTLDKLVFQELENGKKYYLSKINLFLDSERSVKTILDVMAAGGFAIAAYSEKLNSLFSENKEIILFHNLADLIEKIDYYLTHEKERLTIALGGYVAVKNRCDINTFLQDKLEAGRKQRLQKSDDKSIHSNIIEERVDEEMRAIDSLFKETDRKAFRIKEYGIHHLETLYKKNTELYYLYIMCRNVEERKLKDLFEYCNSLHSFYGHCKRIIWFLYRIQQDRSSVEEVQENIQYKMWMISLLACISLDAPKLVLRKLLDYISVNENQEIRDELLQEMEAFNC